MLSLAKTLPVLLHFGQREQDRGYGGLRTNHGLHPFKDGSIDLRVQYGQYSCNNGVAVRRSWDVLLISNPQTGPVSFRPFGSHLVLAPFVPCCASA
jgi:hypothetical protein